MNKGYENMNKNIKAIIITLVVIGIVGIASIIVMAAVPTPTPIATPGVGGSGSGSSTGPDLPYVQVCCMQSEFYIWGDLKSSYGLPITVNVYDKNMNPARNYNVNVVIEGSSKIMNVTKKTGTTGIVRFGFQLPIQDVMKTFGTICPEGDYFCKDGNGNISPYFTLRVTVSGNGQTHRYLRTFAFGWD